MVTSSKRGKAQKAYRPTLSAKRGLTFPAARIHRFLRRGSYGGTTRVSLDAACYLTAVLEYLCAEILELAGNAARDRKKVRITPRHIKLAISNDDELNNLLKDSIIKEGGACCYIHPDLIPNSNKKH